MGILWLASYPKSGNTWIRAFLANYFANRLEPVHINDLPKFAYGDHEAKYYEAVSGQPFASLTDEMLNALRPKVQSYIAGLRSEHVLVKTHSALAKLWGVQTINPAVTIGAIYVIRNPFDMVVSYADHYGMTLDQAVDAVNHQDNAIMTESATALQYLSSWSRHAESWLGAPGLRHIVVRYEDLVAKPEKTFAGVVRFMRLPMDKGRLSRAIRFSGFDTLSKQESQGGFLERSPNSARFFRKGKVGGWRDSLSAAQVERLIEAHGPTLRRFNYVSGTHPRV